MRKYSDQVLNVFTIVFAFAVLLGCLYIIFCVYCIGELTGNDGSGESDPSPEGVDAFGL